MSAEFARSLPAAIDQLPGLLDAIERWLDEVGVPAGKIGPLMIAFDEILSNVAKYGGGTIDLSITIDNGHFSATVADDGPAFDPLARPTPDVDLDIDERQIGGLGIHLVREMMDAVAYTYENGQNRLILSKTL